MAESAFPRKFTFTFALLLVVSAILFYWVWGISYGSWNIFDNKFMGVYAIFVVLLGFGILGLLLYRKKR